ncbi:MAG: hypothetical protein Q7S83_00860 [bacterium]|nr:hypothetical protein [bacterium]
MKKINYSAAAGAVVLFAMPILVGATSVIPVQYELRDSSSDSVDLKVESSVIVDVNRDGLPDLQTVGGRAELDKFNSGTGGDAPSAINTSHSNIKNMISSDNDPNDPQGSPRLLPTVNKKTAKVTVRGWDAEKKEAIMGMEANVKATVEADENISSITIAPDKIEMAYRRPAKLFGFIPVAYQHAFTVDEKGNVAQGHPWWLMFAKDDADNFGSDVKYIFQNNQTDLVFIKMQTIMQQQMQRFSALSNVMKSRHEAAMNSIRNMK